MEIVISGGNGFLGAHFVLACIQRNWSVKALCRPGASKVYFESLVQHYQLDPQIISNCTWLEIDYNDPIALEEAMSRGTHLLHCAGYICFDNREKGNLIRINRNLTATLVDACIKLQYQKIIYLSSIAACSYMDNVQKSVSSRFDSAYGLSKFLGELEIIRGKEEGITTHIVRPGVVLGPPPPSNGLRQLFRWTEKGHLWAPKGGTGFVEVLDLVQYMADLCEGKEEISGTTVGVNLRFHDLTKAIANLLEQHKTVKNIPSWVLQWAGKITRPLYFFSGKPAPLSKASVAALVEINSYPNEDFANTYHSAIGTQNLVINMVNYLKSFGKS